MKKYSTPEVIFDKFTTEEIAISIDNSIEAGDLDEAGAKLDFKETFGL